jgi:hypothetical protein
MSTLQAALKGGFLFFARMAVLMAVLKNIYIFAENRTGPASNRHPTLAKPS